MFALATVRRLVAHLVARVRFTPGYCSAGVQHPLDSRAHVGPTSRSPSINLHSLSGYRMPFFIPHPHSSFSTPTSKILKLWGNVGVFFRNAPSISVGALLTWKSFQKEVGAKIAG